MTPEMVAALHDKLVELGRRDPAVPTQGDYYVPMEHCEAALAAALCAAWRGIASAPKDGDTNILLGSFGKDGTGEQFVAYYEDDPIGGTDFPWQTADGPGYHRDLPTHWTHLLPPPAKD